MHDPFGIAGQYKAQSPAAMGQEKKEKGQDHGQKGKEKREEAKESSQAGC